MSHSFPKPGFCTLLVFYYAVSFGSGIFSRSSNVLLWHLFLIYHRWNCHFLFRHFSFFNLRISCVKPIYIYINNNSSLYFYLAASVVHFTIWDCTALVSSTYIYIYIYIYIYMSIFCERKNVYKCYIYIYIYKELKLVTLLEGDSIAPFSIATTPISRGGRYSFPLIAPFYPWSLP